MDTGRSPKNLARSARLCLGALAAGLLALSGIAAAHEGEEHAAAPAAAAMSADQKAVAGVLDAYAAAMTRNDLAQVKTLAAPGDDFSYFEGTFVNRGWQSFYDHMAPEMALFEKPSYRVSDVRVVLGRELAYATYSWAMDVTVVSDKFEGGRHPVSMSGKATAVFGRYGGAWKVRHMQTATARDPATGAQH